LSKCGFILTTLFQ